MSGEDDFFVGWSGRLPQRHAWFVRLVAAGAVVLMAVLALALARATDDPGGGRFDWAAGEQHLSGRLALAPYPTLWLAPDAAHPLGHTLMLSGTGKTGPQAGPALDGKDVRLGGIMLHRGTLDMLMVTTPPVAATGTALVPPVARLGRWRITGEICDGKCDAGAMRPGQGLAHKACASLCIEGGVPPVLVATGPVEGQSFLLLAGPRNTAMPDALRDRIALRLALEGDVTRYGDLLVFAADLPATTAAR
jgi:hypothetical protein